MGFIHESILLIEGSVLKDPGALCQCHDLVEHEESIFCRDVLDEGGEPVEVVERGWFLESVRLSVHCGWEAHSVHQVGL